MLNEKTAELQKTKRNFGKEDENSVQELDSAEISIEGNSKG